MTRKDFIVSAYTGQISGVAERLHKDVNAQVSSPSVLLLDREVSSLKPWEKALYESEEFMVGDTFEYHVATDEHEQTISVGLASGVLSLRLPYVVKDDIKLIRLMHMISSYLDSPK